MTAVAGPAAEGAEQQSLTEAVRPPGRRHRGSRRASVAAAEGRLALYLIGPTIILLALVIGYPIVYAVYHSLQSDLQNTLLPNGLFAKTTHFIGGRSYVDWLGGRCKAANGRTTACAPGQIQGQFWTAAVVTIGYTIVSVTLETIIGIAFALMMHKSFRGRGLLRAAILVPWAVPTAVTSKLWVVVFDQRGVFNHLLGTNFAWTTRDWPARFAIVIADTWKTTPFMALLILAGLQIIPTDLYESAKVDGASAWQRFTRITLPLARPAIAVAVVFRAMDVLRMYDLPYILTRGATGSWTVSLLVVQSLRNNGQNNTAAVSTIVFVMIFILAFLLFRLVGVNAVRSRTEGVK